MHAADILVSGATTYRGFVSYWSPVADDRPSPRSNRPSRAVAASSSISLVSGSRTAEKRSVGVTGAPDSGPPVVGIRTSSILDRRTDHDEATPTHPGADRAQAP
jgi:hypothetical protein